MRFTRGSISSSSRCLSSASLASFRAVGRTVGRRQVPGIILRATNRGYRNCLAQLFDNWESIGLPLYPRSLSNVRRSDGQRLFDLGLCFPAASGNTSPAAWSLPLRASFATFVPWGPCADLRNCKGWAIPAGLVRARGFSDPLASSWLVQPGGHWGERQARGKAPNFSWERIWKPPAYCFEGT